MQQLVHVCDSCDRTAIDSTRRDLEKKDGWRWVPLKNSLRTFVICGECEDYYAERRKAKAAA